MVYAYDKWEGLPVMLLYDTDIMKMSIAAAKDMYEKGLQLIKDFSTTYGDFITPIQKDLDWYNLNVTGKFRRAVDDLYAKGIDPIRSAEGRMLLSRIVNSVDAGQVAKLRSSAKNAEEFLKARKQLEAQGLYNPLFAKYDGPDINSYSTLDLGVWDKMSPTKMVDMATFGNPYYEGMVGNRHSASKNGIDYTIESITMDDLKGIANAHFNELVSTPQGQMMYKYYRDLAGGDANPNADEAARIAFNNAVADGQRRRMYVRDDYKDNYFKFQELRNARALLGLRQRALLLQAEKNLMLRDKIGGSGSSKSGDSSNKTPVSYYEPLYQNIVVSTLNKDPMRSTTFANNEFTPEMGSSVLSAQRNIAQQYFGDSGKDIYGGVITTRKNNIFGSGKRIDLLGRIDNVKLNYTVDPHISNTKAFLTKFLNNYMDYLNQFSGDNASGFSSMFANSYKGGLSKVDELSYLGKKIDAVKGQNYVSFDVSEIDNIYSAKEIAARMAGITGYLLELGKKETQALRKKLRDQSNQIIMKATKPIGGGTADTGQYSIYSHARFKTVGDDASTITIPGNFVYKTPFSSSPNPNAKHDDNLNLLFDLNTDLERKIMDNAAIRKGFGVTSNTGSIDGTLPDANPWYELMSSDDDFDF